MRGDVRSGNWKRATSFMDVRDSLPNGPSGPLSQLLGCSPNINEPFLTRDNGSLRTRINFISVAVHDGANSIGGAIYLLAGILDLVGEEGKSVLSWRLCGIRCGVTAVLSWSCLVVRWKGSLFPVLFDSGADLLAAFCAGISARQAKL